MLSGMANSSRSELVLPGMRKQWIDDSEFACGDRYVCMHACVSVSECVCVCVCLCLNV